MTARVPTPTVPISPRDNGGMATKGVPMAYCLIVENPEMSENLAQQVFAHVRSSGPVPPEGCRLMLAGPAAPGTRVISVWDSPETAQRFFAERLGRAYTEAGP